MSSFLKILGGIVALAGVVAAVYFAVDRFLIKKNNCEECDEECCFSEEDVEEVVVEINGDESAEAPADENAAE